MKQENLRREISHARHNIQCLRNRKVGEELPQTLHALNVQIIKTQRSLFALSNKLELMVGLQKNK